MTDKLIISLKTNEKFSKEITIEKLKELIDNKKLNEWYNYEEDYDLNQKFDKYFKG